MTEPSKNYPMHRWDNQPRLMSRRGTARWFRRRDFTDSICQTVARNSFFAGGGGPVYAGILKRWNGAAWVKEPLKVYIGGTWQTKPLKFWANDQWNLVDTTGV